MNKLITPKFFNRPTIDVAKELLGKVLVRKIGNKTLHLLIAEVEAYDGFKDKASHIFRGKTERNKIMFEQAGCFYIYFTYGMHYMLNIVTGPKDYPAAILIRSGIEITTEKLKRSNTQKNHINLTHDTCHLSQLNGPAKLTKFLQIDKKFNGLKATPKNNLWFEDRGVIINPKKIIAKKRIGVEYAGKYWANKKWNFSIDYKQFL